jgi:tRNA(Ile)-lysidine synthetase, N-terminal domain
MSTDKGLPRVSSVVRKNPWPRVAEKLAVAIPRERLHPAVLRWIACSPSRERWAVALSGGVDSVVLLLLLWAHWPERRSRLLALHFNHGLRGSDSGADARFCAVLCRALGVGLLVETWKRPRGAAMPSEAEARAARHAFFRTAMGRRRVAALFTGHQRDDVAETLLMRLARGSGASGLSAPRPVHPHPTFGRTHLRPLLTLDKAALAAALRAAGGAWREDASNVSPAYLRNRVRAELLPAWREAAAEPGRDALAGLALSRDLLEEDDQALEVWAERATRVDAKGRLALAPLRRLPRAVLRRVIRRWLAKFPLKTDLNRKGFNGLLDLIVSGAPGARHSLGAAHFVRITRTRVCCEPVETTRF